jgi:S-adenosylmethionine:tRNA ribosyltransferase-isomerase
VGAGTFLPVKTEELSEHQMHSEFYTISADAAAAINEARNAGGRVIAVGTTSLRALESATDDNGVLQAQSADTDIFITPGYQFKMVDVLQTNFHIPKSTLFMLVSAFAGFDKMKEAYTHAIANKYRFYSYGDACWLER